MKKILENLEVNVKGHRCIVVDPSNQKVRLKLHWLLYNAADEDFRAALAPYGKVGEVCKERWRVTGVQEKSSTTRTVNITLKAGLKVYGLPHQLRVAGELALLLVPKRAPQCLRCGSTGHVRRECKVPRCTSCRRFGHEASERVRTYAKVTGPTPQGEIASEFIMDEADA